MEVLMRERASFLECWEAQRMFHDDDCFGWFISGWCWWAYENKKREKERKKENYTATATTAAASTVWVGTVSCSFHFALTLSPRLISIFYLCLMSIYFWFSWEFFFLFFFASTFHHSLFPLSLPTKTDKYA
jgi:hypothetical protein